jgi:hypothetical protein
VDQVPFTSPYHPATYGVVRVTYLCKSTSPYAQLLLHFNANKGLGNKASLEMDLDGVWKDWLSWDFGTEPEESSHAFSDSHELTDSALTPQGSFFPRHDILLVGCGGYDLRGGLMDAMFLNLDTGDTSLSNPGNGNLSCCAASQEPGVVLLAGDRTVSPPTDSGLMSTTTEYGPVASLSPTCSMTTVQPMHVLSNSTSTSASRVDRSGSLHGILVKQAPDQQSTAGNSFAKGNNPATKVKKQRPIASRGKQSHTAIERRYRSKLGDTIIELRSAVPSLRAVKCVEGSAWNEDLDGLTPARKLNKSTVIAKATEYIRHLEFRNRSMAAKLSNSTYKPF